jgi:Major tropism determinant N-terminal domain
MAVTIQLRRDTAANWTSANSILASGEAGVETDTLLFKIGDGSTAWNSLAYAGGSSNIALIIALGS